MDVRVAPQPCQLPLGILPGAKLDLLDGLGHGAAAVCRRQKLLVADGLPRRSGGRQPRCQQGLHLLQQPLPHHLIHPQVDASAQLRRRIDLRVDEMVRQGLLEEVQALLAAGLPPTATAWQAIGYKQFLAAADGRCTVAEAIEEVKLRSRQYAKRQLTWLRRNPDIHWILWGEEPNFPQGLQNATEYLTALGLR